MTKPDAVIHIGFNKCGSTAIQRWLGETASELEELGTCYMRTDPRPDIVCTNPHMLVLAYTLADQTIPFRPLNTILGFGKDDRVQQDIVAYEYKAALEVRISSDSCKQFVASSEPLAGRPLTVDVMTALASWLSDTFNSVRYIAYIRNPEAWMCSLYGHDIRGGRTSDTFEEFVQRVQTVPFAMLLKRWVSVVGKSAIDVRLFDEKWLTGPGLLDDFSQQLKVRDQLTFPALTGINTSWRSDARGSWRKVFPRMKASNRLPTRPRLSPSVSQALFERNIDELDWIEETFFKDRSAEFRTWKRPNDT